MIRRICWLMLISLLLWTPATARADRPETPKKPQQSDYELYKMLIDTFDQIERNYITEVDRRKLIESAIRGALSGLDPHSSYITADELRRFREDIASEFGGIGVQIDADAEGLKILSPIHGTPAHRAGLAAGDSILRIDGRPTEGLTIDEAVNLLKGDEGSKITLVILRSGDTEPRKVTLTREKIHIDTVLGNSRNSDGTWNFMLDPRRKIAYVRLTAFSRNTAGELRRTLARLKSKGMRGLILDLRFNPGGLLAAAIETADLFIAEGRIVSANGRNTPKRSWDARKKGTIDDLPMAVLINRYSASSSEIVAACLQDHGRAAVIGERTWGKGSVQNLIELGEGHGAIKLTTSGYLRPNGKNIHRLPKAKDNDDWGVKPDDGYRIRLETREMLELIRDRRRRDILKSPGNTNDLDESVAVGPSKFDDRQLGAAQLFLAEKLDIKSDKHAK